MEKVSKSEVKHTLLLALGDRLAKLSLFNKDHSLDDEIENTTKIMTKLEKDDIVIN